MLHDLMRAFLCRRAADWWSGRPGVRSGLGALSLPGRACGSSGGRTWSSPCWGWWGGAVPGAARAPGDRLRLPDAGRGALDPDELVIAGAVGDPQAADEQRTYADGLDDRDVLDAVPGLDAVGLAAQRHGGARLDQRHAPSLLAGAVALGGELGRLGARKG